MSGGIAVRAVAVVMRVTTLKASSDRLPGLLAYYAGLAEDRERPGLGRGPVDYYLDPEEPPGRWWGRGREALGLDGPVSDADMRAMLEAQHPETGRRLGRRFGDASARGFDATFSAPKSVSVLWALTPDAWVRAEVLAAHDAAVDAALGWLETHGAVTRRGRDGLFQLDTRGLTVAVFRQHTSRTADPQLHSHAVIAAKVQDPSGRWLSLDARFLKYQQRSIGAVYDAALRAELTSRLGVSWTERGPGVVDLDCVPDVVREGFSKRSTQVDAKHAELIRRWSDEHDGRTPSAKVIGKLERRAAKASRPDKTHGVDAGTLHADWTREAHAMGFDPAGLMPARIVDERRTGWTTPDDDLIDEALLHASEESSAWLGADLARHLATILDTGSIGSGAELVAEIDRLAALAEARCVPLGPVPDGTIQQRRDGRPITEHVTERLLTTPRVLDEERALLAWAAKQVRPPRRGDDPRVVAAREIAGHAPLVLVVGPAGTGKTYATAQAVAALKAERRPVIGLAPSGKAADVLAREADCATDTVAGFLTRHQHRTSPWPAGTTVILDEAGMIATADLARLVELARANRWRLALVGDPEQLPSVERGGVFAHWCNTLPHHTLDEPRRFTHPWEAAASLALRVGDPDAVDAYVARHRVSTSHPALAASQVARAHERHAAAGRSVAITTTTSDTARAINLEIQRNRRPHDEGVPLRDGTRAHAGDQIATRRNDFALRTAAGERVRNRHTWTVTDTHPDGSLTVAHPQRGSVELPGRYVAEHVELGWAVTGYGTQGDTVDIGIAVLDHTTSRNHAYVAMTRGRDANHAVILDRTGTQDPGDQLATIITRTAHGDSAIAIQQRLHQTAGTEIPAPAHPAPAIPGPEGPGPAKPTWSDPTLEDQVAKIQQRLDRLQHQPVEPSRGVSLGL